MQTMTIRDVGGDGVATAIADGMLAGEYARKLRAAHAENETLRNVLATERAENRRLCNENRRHRFSKSRAYEGALEAQITGVSERGMRLWKNAVMFLAGMVAGLTVAFSVILIYGVR